MIRFTAMLDSTRSRGIVPLRFQAIAGSAAMLVAIPFTSVRLVPVAPKAPIAITSPAPMQVVAPAVIERTLAASNGERISIDLRPARQRHDPRLEPAAGAAAGRALRQPGA